MICVGYCTQFPVQLGEGKGIMLIYTAGGGLSVLYWMCCVQVCGWTPS